ncbi:MAG: glycosyltransferase [Cyclobacteriaceae bacterium]
MHVIHIVESFATGTFEFIRLLIKYSPEEVHTIIYSERELNIEEAKAKFSDNVSFIPWRFAQREIGLNDVKAAMFLRKELKKLEYDVVHLHSSKAGILGRLAAFTIGEQRVIFTPNGASFARRDISKKSKLFYILIERLVAKMSGKVVCCSRSERDLFIRHGIHADFVSNATETNFTQPSTKFDRFTIVTSGRIGPQKNPELFNTIAQSASFEKIQFLWIGDGDEREKLGAQNIEITGWVSREEALNLISQSHIYLSTALWEGLPFSVLEAMAAGLPTVLMDIPPHRDMTRDGINGYLYKTEEEAVKALNKVSKSDRLNKLGEESHRLIKQEFSADRMAKSYLSHYRSLL